MRRPPAVIGLAASTDLEVERKGRPKAGIESLNGPRPNRPPPSDEPAMLELPAPPEEPEPVTARVPSRVIDSTRSHNI
eukprot:9689-Chlamydomonas_euryale.AAC.1